MIDFLRAHWRFWGLAVWESPPGHIPSHWHLTHSRLHWWETTHVNKIGRIFVHSGATVNVSLPQRKWPTLRVQSIPTDWTLGPYAGAAWLILFSAYKPAFRNWGALPSKMRVEACHCWPPQGRGRAEEGLLQGAWLTWQLFFMTRHGL